MNKTAQQSLTKTGILFVVIVFYTILSIFVGFALGQSYTQESENINDTNFFDFIGTVITGYAELPAWINTLLFSPLVIMLTWIIVSSLPTFNGGG